MEFQDIKTKQDLMCFINRDEKISYNGLSIELRTVNCLGSNDFLKITVSPITPFHAPLTLGNKWLEYTTDEEIAELIPALDKYKQEALEYQQKVRTITHKYTLTDDPDILIDLSKAGKKNNKAKITRIDGGYFQISNASYLVQINDKTYVPIWSYWLDRACYKEGTSK